MCGDGTVLCLCRSHSAELLVPAQSFFLRFRNTLWQFTQLSVSSVYASVEPSRFLALAFAASVEAARRKTSSLELVFRCLVCPQKCCRITDSHQRLGVFLETLVVFLRQPFKQRACPPQLDLHNCRFPEPVADPSASVERRLVRPPLRMSRMQLFQ